MVNDIAIQDFVNAIKEAPQDTNRTYNATVSHIDNEGVVWVYLQGSSKETPTASTSTEVKKGDAVTVQWRNNKLYIGGNYSNPSAGVGTVMPSVDFITELIDKDVTVNSINAATGYIGELTSENITAENIVVTNGYIKELTAEGITADDIVADHAEVGDLDVNYAKINAANVTDLSAQNAWVNKIMVQTGLLAHEGTVFTLDAIQVNAANITAGTIDVNRLIVTVEGQKYLVNVDPTTGTPSYEKMDGNIVEPRTITADKIVAHDITVQEITTENLVGTNGWINLNLGRFFYGNGANYASSTNAIDWNGTTLKIKGDIGDSVVFNNYSTTTEMNTAIGNAVDGIEVGGRNLVKGSDVSRTQSSPGAVTEGGSVTRTVPSGTQITISCRIDADNIAWQSGTFGRIGCETWVTKSDGTGTQYIGAWAGQAVREDLNTVEAFTGSFHKRISKTFTLLGDLPIDKVPCLYVQGVASGTYSVSRIQIEIGNKATDWAPAPEDVQAEIDAKKSTHTLMSSSNGNTYANILAWTAEGRENTYWEIDTTATPIDKIKVGDTVRVAYKVTDMNNVYVYLIGTFERSSGSAIYLTMHGLDSTVIDGGHILTGTIDANKVNIQNLTVGSAQSGWNGVMNSNIKVGGRNILKNSASSVLYLWSTAANNGGTMTITANQTVAEWRATDAYRVQGKAGSTSALFGIIDKVYASEQASISGQSYVFSIYIKNQGSNSIWVNFNSLGTGIEVRAGETKRVISTDATGNGSSYVQFTISASAASANYDFTYWHPQIEYGNSATDWSPAVEDADGSRNYAITNFSTVPIGKTETRGSGVTATLLGASTIKLNGTSTTTDWFFSTSDVFGGQTFEAGTYACWATTPNVILRIAKQSTYFGSVELGTKSNPTLLVLDSKDTYWFTPYSGIGKSFSNQIVQIMIEKSTTASDWSPAPEDVQSQIDAKKSIHTLNSSYSVAYATALAWTTEGRVDQWAVDSTAGVRVGDTARIKFTVSDMNNAVVYAVVTITEVPSATLVKTIAHGLDTTVIDGGNILTNSIGANKIKVGEINIGAAQITSGTIDSARIPNLSADKITSGTINIGRIPADALNSNIQVGGRNLLRDTETWKNWTCTANATVSGNVLTTTNTAASGGFQRANGWFALPKADIYNSTVTISFEVKKTASTALNSLVFQLFTTNQPYKSVSSGNITEGTRWYNSLASSDFINTSAINANTWTKVYTKPIVMANVFNTSYTEYDYLACYIGINNTVASASFRNLKIEYGNTATAWSAAPEDFQIGGVNLLKFSNASTTSATIIGGTVTKAIPKGTTITISIQVDADNVVWDSTNNYHRVGCETSLAKDGGGTQYIGAWAGNAINEGANIVKAFTGTFHGRVSKTFTLLGDMSINAGVYLYVQGKSSGTVTVSRPQIEIGSTASNWALSPEETTYITHINNDGIRIHPSSTENNSVVVNADGMEVFKGGTTSDYSIAKYGESARIGKETDSNIVVTSASITGDSGDGEYFDVSNNGGQLTTVTYQTTNSYSGTGAVTINLASSAFTGKWNTIANGGAFRVKIVYKYRVRIGTDKYTYQTKTTSTGFTKGTANSGTYVTYNGASSITLTASYPSVSGGTYLGRNSVALGKVETTATPLYRFGHEVAEDGGAYGFTVGHGTKTFGKYQLACGEYNASYTDAYFMVGNGSSDSARSNAFVVDKYSDVLVGGTIVHTSDRRLKKHISYLDDDAIDFVNKLKPVYFIKDGKKQVGFYAQDVAEADRWKCMIGDDLNGYMTLNYEEIIAPLVTYVQKLEKRIEELEGRQ